MVVLQALSEYMIKRPPPDDLSLDVDIRITGRRDVRYHFNPRTAYGARSSKVRDTKRNIKRIWLCGRVYNFKLWCFGILEDLECKNIIIQYFSSSLVLLLHSCLLTLIWKSELKETDREYLRYEFTERCLIKLIRDIKLNSRTVPSFGCITFFDWLISLPEIWPKVVTHYNQLHEVDEKMPCQHFELTVAIEESRGNSIYMSQIQQIK